jgi:hypothetical protein
MISTRQTEARMPEPQIAQIEIHAYGYAQQNLGPDSCGLDPVYQLGATRQGKADMARILPDEGVAGTPGRAQPTA